MPEQKRDEALPVVKTEEIVSEEMVSDAPLDITMGDMENDLPTAGNDSAAAAVSGDAAPSSDSEMEIPWGEMELSGEGEESEATAEGGTESAVASQAEGGEGQAAEAEAPLPIKRVLSCSLLFRLRE